MMSKYLLSAIFILMIFIACEESNTNKGDSGNLSDIILTNPEFNTLSGNARLIGFEVSNDLIKVLGSELKAALEEGDVEKAIKTCNIKALPLTAEVASNYNVQLKRVSEKYRNAANKPTSIDLQVLDYFKSQLEKENDHTYFLVTVEEQEGKNIYTYHHALFTNELCLQCHGNASDFSDEIRNRLDELYPNDLAVGYELGDLRGMIKVMISE